MASCIALTNTTQFHPFPRLPKELRDSIWQATLEPRIVYVHAHLLQPGFANRIWSNKILDDDTFFDLGSSSLTPRPRLAFKSKSKVPIILYVCSESRDVVTRIYSLAFGHSSYPRTWFAFKYDTLVVDWRVNRLYGRDVRGVVYDAYLPEDLGVDAGKVERLALYGPSGVQEIDSIVEVLERFNNLEILKVVDRIHHFEDRHSADLIEPGFFTPPATKIDILKNLKESTMAVDEELEDREQSYRWKAHYNNDAYVQVLSQLQKNQRSGAHTLIKIPPIQITAITSRERYDEYIQARKQYDIEKELRPTVIELR